MWLIAIIWLLKIDPGEFTQISGIRLSSWKNIDLSRSCHTFSTADVVIVMQIHFPVRTFQQIIQDAPPGCSSLLIRRQKEAYSGSIKVEVYNTNTLICPSALDRKGCQSCTPSYPSFEGIEYNDGRADFCIIIDLPGWISIRMQPGSPATISVGNSKNILLLTG